MPQLTYYRCNFTKAVYVDGTLVLYRADVNVDYNLLEALGFTVTEGDLVPDSATGRCDYFTFDSNFRWLPPPAEATLQQQFVAWYAYQHQAKVARLRAELAKLESIAPDQPAVR